MDDPSNIFIHGYSDRGVSVGGIHGRSMNVPGNMDTLDRGVSVEGIHGRSMYISGNMAMPGICVNCSMAVRDDMGLSALLDYLHPIQPTLNTRAILAMTIIRRGQSSFHGVMDMLPLIARNAGKPL